MRRQECVIHCLNIIGTLSVFPIKKQLTGLLLNSQFLYHFIHRKNIITGSIQLLLCIFAQHKSFLPSSFMSVTKGTTSSFCILDLGEMPFQGKLRHLQQLSSSSLFRCKIHRGLHKHDLHSDLYTFQEMIGQIILYL